MLDQMSQPSPEQTNLVILFHFVKFFAVILIVGALIATIYFNNRRRCREADELLKNRRRNSHAREKMDGKRTLIGGRKIPKINHISQNS